MELGTCRLMFLSQAKCLHCVKESTWHFFCCFMSAETMRTIEDGESRTATSTFTQLLSSVHDLHLLFLLCVTWQRSLWKSWSRWRMLRWRRASPSPWSVSCPSLTFLSAGSRMGNPLPPLIIASSSSMAASTGLRYPSQLLMMRRTTPSRSATRAASAWCWWKVSELGKWVVKLCWDQNDPVSYRIVSTL